MDRETQLRHLRSLNWGETQLDEEKLQSWIKEGFDINVINEYGMGLLYYYVSQPQMISLFIKYGADVRTKTNNGISPLLYAHGETISILIQAGLDPNEDNEIFLWHVIDAPNVNDVRILLENGADPYIRNKKGVPLITFSDNIVQYYQTKGVKGYPECMECSGWYPNRIVCNRCFRPIGVQGAYVSYPLEFKQEVNTVLHRYVDGVKMKWLTKFYTLERLLHQKKCGIIVASKICLTMTERLDHF